MARQYKFEIKREGVDAELYVHDDDTLEITDPDSGTRIEYLTTKLELLKKMVEWMKTHEVTNVECKYLPPA